MEPIKYPRTVHLPWSEGATNDDLRLGDCSRFEGHEVVVTEKMDGENMTLYSEGLHARALTMRSHPSHAWIKGYHSSIAYIIPKGWRVCGEYLFARHSIPYNDLKSYFYVFSVWDENNCALSWDETVAFAKEINAAVPSVFYKGVWCKKRIEEICTIREGVEGYVVRKTGRFLFSDFQQSVAKWVRKDHVQQDSEHWMNKALVANGIIRQ